MSSIIKQLHAQPSQQRERKVPVSVPEGFYFGKNTEHEISLLDLFLNVKYSIATYRHDVVQKMPRTHSLFIPHILYLFIGLLILKLDLSPPCPRLLNQHFSISLPSLMLVLIIVQVPRVSNPASRITWRYQMKWTDFYGNKRLTLQNVMEAQRSSKHVFWSAEDALLCTKT